MLAAEENDLLCMTGPGTPGGEMIRRYWQPVALAEEMPAGAPPKPIRILSEELTLFRDGMRRLGLLGIHCSHRAADLSYGRIENGGLRCLYHGWLYDVEGNCIEQPGEPEGSNFKDKVKQLSYPVKEAGGLIFAYMGPGEPPLLPAYEFMTAPDESLFASKVFSACNYLQGNEGNLDPAHLSFLHKFFKDGERSRVVTGGISTSNTYFGTVVSPTIEVEPADFGLRIFTVRDAEDGKTYVRITNFVYPCLATNPQGIDGYNVNWHVPIDDHTSWKIRVGFKRGGPIDKLQARADFMREVDDEWVPHRNIGNHYQQDRDEMEATSFIGMGRFFPVHDLFATENQGPIQDRTREHLGYTDKAIAAHRRLLLGAVRAVQEGVDPPHVIRDASQNRMDDIVCADAVIPAGQEWRTTWREHLVQTVTR